MVRRARRVVRVYLPSAARSLITIIVSRARPTDDARSVPRPQQRPTAAPSAHPPVRPPADQFLFTTRAFRVPRWPGRRSAAIIGLKMSRAAENYSFVSRVHPPPPALPPITQPARRDNTELVWPGT